MNDTLSYVSGASAFPLLGETIGAHFHRAAEAAPDAVALIVRHQNIRWTWRNLAERVDQLACALIRLGLSRGDRIGIWAPNCAEWLLLQLASASSGLILVAINPAYRRNEVEYALNKVGCKALVLAPIFKSNDYISILNALAPELAHCQPGLLESVRLPSLRIVVRLGDETTPGMLNFGSLLASAGARERQQLAELSTTLQFDDPVNIQFTSGTTGHPKGATLTHHNILNNAFFIGDLLGLGPRDRLCIPVPLYHCFGMVAGNLACVAHRATMVYPAAAFDARSVLETVEAEGCTALYGVPTMFIATLAHPSFDDFDLSSLRTGIMAGAPCPIELMQQVITRMHLPELTIAYGMTETSPASFQSRATEPLEARISTVGRAHPHLEVKIVDDHGKITRRRQPGELCVRGYSVMQGYWDDPQKTAETIDRSGWLHTGDLATLDEDGRCRIVGRLKDVVIRGGENIYPPEVEEVLHRHPQVRDVQCVGVPDANYGEALCACIIPEPGATVSQTQLRTFCEGEMAHYKVPRYFCFVDSFPVTVTGKVQKFILRDRMASLLQGTNPDVAKPD